MIWGLIKLIILGMLVTTGIVIYEDIEKNQRQHTPTPPPSSGWKAKAAERPSTEQYKPHPSPDIGPGHSDNVYHNFSCNDLSRLNTRMRNAYDDYQYSGQSWDRDKYYKAKRDFDAVKKQCY